GPFYIKNNYTGNFGAGPYASGSWHQYIYDDNANTSYTETNCCSSPSDATAYTSSARLSRNVQSTDGAVGYADNEAYMFVVETSPITVSGTNYRIKNIKNGRYINCGPNGDYYNENGDQNSLNLVPWISANVGAAT